MSLQYSPEFFPTPPCVNVLIIDGAYFQIGISELNKQYGTNFRIENVETKFTKILAFMANLVHLPSFDKVVFVSAEDYDGMTRNEAFYLKI